MKLMKVQRGEEFFIADVKDEDEAWEEINHYLRELGTKIYYIRCWVSPNNENMRVYDYGSHSDFFHLYMN